jgi:hypothetical protein
MVSFLFWTLMKLTMVVVVGYFINELISKARTDKQLNEIGRQYEQHLIENAYPHLREDIEAALTLTGLQMHEQKYPLYQKPVFHFKLSNQNTLEEIRSFLSSLPQQFEVSIPSLKISIEDSLLQSVCFWKYEEKFQLALKQPGVYKTLALAEIEQLAKRIHETSAEFNFQNVSVKRLIVT